MEMGVSLERAVTTRGLTPHYAFLDRIKSTLTQLYASRLRGLYLVGSRARGDHRSDSDWDILIILDTCDYDVELPRIEPHRLELQSHFGFDEDDLLSLSPLSEAQFWGLDRTYEGITGRFQRDAIDLLA